MSWNTQWDGTEFPSLDLPYNRIIRELSDEPRLVTGLNGYITYGGKLAKRPGIISVADTNLLALRVDRLWIYETIDNPPLVYLVASVYNSATLRWELRWRRLDDTSQTAWQTVTSTRDVNLSTRAHEAVVARGKLFVKGFPSTASTEKLGTIIFDASGGNVNIRLWGLLGPTTPARIVGVVPRLAAELSADATSCTVNSASGLPAAPFNLQIEYELVRVTNVVGTTLTITRGYQHTYAELHRNNTVCAWLNWTASSHRVTIQFGWQYSYAYKSITNHISNRAPVETNIDALPSTTGPFFDLIPQLTVQGHADTTNIPSIVIYRTADGGGTFYTLKTITNTGAGAITVSDTDLSTDAGLLDPQPDSVITKEDPGPTLNSNSPPTTVNAPEVVGTDVPDPSSPIAYYAGRIWYGIGNTLHYSGDEEISVGVPEEAFPTGLKGNTFRLQYPIANIKATTDALYVTTLQGTYEITGTNKETFNPRLVLNNVGAPIGHPRAMTEFGDVIAWLTHDYRIAMLSGNNFRVISDPLFTDIVDAVNAGAEIQVVYWADLDKEYVLVAAHRRDNITQSRQWVYDLKKSTKMATDFWFVPWSLATICLASGRMLETAPQRRLLVVTWDGTNCALSRLDATARTATDDIYGAADSAIDFSITTSLFRVPSGNHVNTLRKPGLYPVLYGFKIDRLLFTADQDPQVYCFKDDIWTDPIRLDIKQTAPARIPNPKGYKTMEYNFNGVCHRMGLKISKINSKDLFEAENLILLWQPDGGA